MGVIHYDTTNNRYIVFADNETKDSYLEDPTQTELILGTFDAPFNYTASINLLTSNYVAILTGTTGNVIRFTFDVVNKQGSSVGENVLCTYTFIKGSTKKVVKARYRYNEEVSFSVDDYISDGTNNIIISITGETTLAATSLAITYQVVNLFISDEYDISRVYNLNANPNAVAEIPFTVKGYGTKTVEWYLDKEQLPEESYIDEVTSTEVTRTKNISLSNLQEGIHSIQLRAYTIINGEKFYSKTLYREIIIHNGVSQNNYIAVAAELPMGKVITNVEHFYGTQFIDFPLRLAAYSPINAASINVRVSIDGTNITTVAVQNGIVYDLLIPLSNSGELDLVLTDGSVSNVKVIEVSVGDIKLEEMNDGLALYLTAKGKTNSAIDKDSWVYKSVSTTFSGFKWNSISGWNNGALYIPNGASISIGYAPLAGNVTAKGKTIEFEIGSTNVYDDNAILMDLRNSNGVGLLITASEITLTSAGGAKISKRYMSNEVIRVSIVINRTSGVNNKCLAFIYVNGENGGAVNFAETDNFTSNSDIVISGSESATAIIKSIRIYDIALSDEQILNNYAFYSDNVTKLSIINRNNILNSETNEIDYSKVANQLPVMIITGDIPSLEETNDKDKSIKVDVKYINNQDPDLSFTMKNAKMKIQGTSSLRYPKKNYKLYSNDSTDTIVYDSEGKIIADRLYAFKKGSIPVSVWCFKADYAESSGTHNTGIAKLWNDVLKNAKILDIDSRYYDNTSEYVFRTKAQKAAISNDYPYDVRTTVDGFPICIFYKMTEDSELVFLGKYNFNNDKSTENVFGFKDIPGFDNTNMQCWEILDNGNPLSLFTDISNFDSGWKDAYESRYPDTKKPNTAQLKSFCQWVNSTSNFSNEKWQHLDVYKVAAYYIYLMRHGAVDQAVKNAMLTSEDGQHFFFILYDNDTTHGLRNDSLLIYEPTIDRQSLDPTASTTVYAYAGHDSVLWNSLEADTEFMEIVEKVDAALYNAGLTYDNAIKMFDVEQAGKWCERIYNADAQYKYIGPFNESAINNLYMLQGSRKTHRKWWLSRRFSIYDAIWGTGNFKSQSITFKLLTAPSGLNFTITSGYNTSYGYGINNVIIAKGIKLAVNESHTFTTERVLNIGDPVGIYSANNLRAVDLSELAAYISTLDISKVYSETLGTQLKKLVIGKIGTVNTSLASIDGLISAEKLEYLDITGFKGLTNLPLESLENLKTLIADNCGVTSFTFKDGASLEVLRLPINTNALVLSHVDTLSQDNFSLPTSIRTLSIKNCSQLCTNIGFFKNYMFSLVNAMSQFEAAEEIVEFLNGLNITIEGIDFRGVLPPFSSSEESSPNWLLPFIYIDYVATEYLNQGYEVKKCSFKGRIEMVSVAEDDLEVLSSIYGDNCFNPKSSFYFKAPNAIYLHGDGVIVEGGEYQYSATIFSDEEGTLSYSVSGRTGVTISSNGLLSVEETGAAGNIIIEAAFSSVSGAVMRTTKTVTVQKATYPSSVSINGEKLINQENQEFEAIIQSGNFTGNYRFSWELSEEVQPYVEITSTRDNFCFLNRKGTFEGVYNGNLICKIVKNFNNAVAASAQLAISVAGGNAIMTSITNPEVMAIMYANGLCANEIYMTREEAAAVTENQLKPSSGNSIFYNNTNIKTFKEFKYFVSLTQIPQKCFQGCSGLTSLVIPNSVTSIGSWAFHGCTSLTSVNIPNSVTSINSEAFLGGIKLNKVEISDLEAWCKISFEDYFANPIYFAHHLFLNGQEIKNLIIPETVQELKSYVFYNCSGLTSVVIPNSVTSIGMDAFRECSGLTSVSIGNSVTEIGRYAFSNCTSLTSVEIPNSVTSINSYAFEGSGLTSIKIPNSVTFIGNYAFQSCSSLESITVESGNTVYDSRNNCNALIKTATNLLICGCKNTIIPNSVTSISDYAFDGCSGLTSIEIPSSVTKIGDYAFNDCRGLTLIKIANSVTSIGKEAFVRCSNLETIRIFTTKAPTVQSDTFGSGTHNYTGRNNYDKGTNILYVPSGATGYNASSWASVLLDSTKCGFTISYTL